MSDKLEQLVKELSKNVASSLEKLKQLKPDKWNLKSFVAVAPEIFILLRELVTGVEKISKQVGVVTGSDKKSAVMAILETCINGDYLKIPYVPKWLSKKLLGLAVDWVVQYYNEKFGKGTGENSEKDWIEEPTFTVLSVR